MRLPMPTGSPSSAPRVAHHGSVVNRPAVVEQALGIGVRAAAAVMRSVNQGGLTRPCAW